MTNPWNLPMVEQQVLDMVCIKGCHKLAATALRMERSSVSRILSRARERMQLPNNTRALIEWDRFAMGRDEAVDNSEEARAN